MSNNKIFLFLGASLSLIPDLSAAQCVYFYFWGLRCP